jgi:hypothetical protein
MERDIIERLREMSGPIVPNLVTEAADEIERLRRGGCARDQKTTQYCAEAVRLQAERDEARREVCCLFESSIAYSVKTGMIGFANPEYESLLKHARTRGWDCFKEDAK